MSENFLGELIDASLDPQRLDLLEMAWEAFLDQSLERFTDDKQSSELARQVERALDILTRLNIATDRQRSAQQLVDSNPGAAIVIGQSGAVLARNASFELQLRPINRITEISDFDSVARWIRTTAESRGIYHFHSAVLREGRQATFLCVQLEGALHPGETVFFVTELDVLVQGENLSQIMDAYNLTRAEAEVCIQLANGSLPSEISELRSVSIHTIRSQIKSSIEKTGARNTTDLVRGLCGLAARVSYIRERGANGLPGGHSVAPSREIMRDGRSIEFFEQGAPFGLPVVYLHGLWDGPVLFRPVAEHAEAAGLRFIGVSRPGFGQSDPCGSRDLEDSLNSFCSDLVQLLDKLGIDRVVILGQHHALRFAGSHPQRTLGLVHVNGLPVWAPDMISDLTDRRRNLVKTSIRWPGSVRLLVKLGMALLKAGKEDLFLRGLAKGSRANSEILLDPEFFEHAKAECRHNSAQGAEPFLFEVPLLHTDTSDDLRRLSVPVNAVLYEDRSHTPQNAIAHYKELVPGLTATFCAGHGDLWAQAIGICADMWSSADQAPITKFGDDRP